LTPAPVPRRLAAFCYDRLLLAALIFAFTLLLLALRGGKEIAPGTVWFELCLMAIALLFFGGFWTHGGQTLGMRAWRIRVVDADGGPLDWRRAVLRFGAAIVAVLPAGLGLWWALFDSRGRGWHDRWARTLVVRATSAADASAPAPRQPP
jgi:uncharacterized RDD family membrane protein YckC